MRLLSIGLLSCIPLFASTTQPFFGTTGISAFFTNTATSYFGLSMGTGPAFSPSASPSGYYALMPTSGVLHGMCFDLGTAPASGKTWTFNIYKNGAVPANTLTVTFNNTSGLTLCDNADIVRFAAGDLICIQNTESGNPAASTGNWYVLMTPDIPGETILFTGSPAQSAQFYSAPGMSEQANGTEANVAWPIASAGVIEKMWAQSVTQAGSGKSWKVIFDLNSTAQGLAVTLSNIATAQSDISVSDYVTVSAGNRVSINYTIPLGTPATSDVYASVVFLPTVLGNFLIPAVRNGAPSNSTNNYAGLIGRAPSWTGTETQAQQVAPAMQMQALYLTATTALTTGSYALTLRDAAASTAVTVTINASSTYPVSITGQTVKISQGDLIDALSAPTSSPSTPGTLIWSFLGYIPPTDSHFFSVLE